VSDLLANAWTSLTLFAYVFQTVSVPFVAIGLGLKAVRAIMARRKRRVRGATADPDE
jgi:hypothetical protein